MDVDAPAKVCPETERWERADSVEERRADSIGGERARRKGPGRRDQSVDMR
jgi:hypothetical protein